MDPILSASSLPSRDQEPSLRARAPTLPTPQTPRSSSQPELPMDRSPSISKDDERPNPGERTGSTTLYPKIFKLTDFIYAVKSISEYQELTATIPLFGSTKLHGTHADIVFETCNATDFRLQSRNQLSLTAGEKDNAGFAAYIASVDRAAILRLRDRFVERYRKLNPNHPGVKGEVIIAAEWCGTGIQNKVAVSKMAKFMAIISVFIDGAWVPDWEYQDIEDETDRIFHIGRAGFFQHGLRLDDVAESEKEIKKLTDEVERACPFAKAVCGEAGLGEGIVWKAASHCGDPKFWFKSKGDLLAVSNVSKMPASAVNLENRERIENFAKAIVTEVRLEQGWDYLSQKSQSRTGLFLKWIIEDCLVEEKREMENLEISKNKLAPAIVSIAKPWFLAKLSEVNAR